MMNMNLVGLVRDLGRSRLWCRRLLLLSFCLISVAAVIPYGSAASTVTVVSVDLDKILHFVGFACVVLFAFGASKGLIFWHLMRAVAYVLIFGVVIEFVQYYIPYRTFNPLDILANVCGVLFGVLLATLFRAKGAEGEKVRG
jgi:VanZ family protein